MPREGIGAHLVGGQAGNAVPFGTGQRNSVLAVFPDIGQTVAATPSGIRFDAIGYNGIAAVFRGLCNDLLLSRAVHHPITGNVVASPQQVKHTYHRHASGSHGK